MDFCLRCNSLSCRSSLKERAVVTTCSHIFCLQCAEGLGLSLPTGAERRCPACQAILINPDDAVATILNPTEDYKTSVLSGLDPNTIVECAGRALLFWTYQTTQEIFYQEFLAKTLTDKYTNLNTQMDKVIHNANMEISTLQARLSDMQIAQEQLRKKNQELVDMYKDKCKKFSQITNLYNLLKSRAMRSHMQTAAVSQALQSLEPSHINLADPSNTNISVSGPSQSLPSYQQKVFPVDSDGVELLHRHQRSGTGSSKGTKQKPDTGIMAPPGRPLGHMRNTNPPIPTPHHRARLPGPSRPSTSISQLPHESIMLGRFQANSGQNEDVTNGQIQLTREALVAQPTRPAEQVPSRIRSLFDSTII